MTVRRGGLDYRYRQWSPLVEKRLLQINCLIESNGQGEITMRASHLEKTRGKSSCCRRDSATPQTEIDSA